MNINKQIAIIVAQTETVMATWNTWVESPTVYNSNRFVDASRNVSLTLDQIASYENHALWAFKTVLSASNAAAWDIRAFADVKVQDQMRRFIGHVKALNAKV